MFSLQCEAIETDKAAHFGIGAVAQTACEALFSNAFRTSGWGMSAFCLTLVTMGAIMKEAGDAMHGGDYDDADVLAGVGGAASAAVLIKLRF